MLSPDEFVRELSLNVDVAHMFLLGAGASVSSGIPPASVCVQDWKKAIFRSRFPDRECTRDNIEDWIDSQQGFPPDGASDEYGFYARQCYPNADARRRYFDRLCHGKKPSSGYEFLTLLARSEMVKAVWTTNFDGLAAKAMVPDFEVIEAGLDTAGRAGPPFQRRKALCVALHGDYRYDELRNLPQEVQKQDQTLRQVLVRRAQDYPLVVAGYSGRDASIMEMLTEAYSTKVYGRLYWCDLRPEPSETVGKLLRSAIQNGNEANYVPGVPFDSLLGRLASYSLEGDLAKEAKQLLAAVQAPPPVPTSSAVREKSVRDQIQEFAKEYADIRDRMKASDERTRKMEDVLSARIRILKLEPWFLLPELTQASSQPGEKLAAVVMLQQKPHPDYISFLSECMKEKPFVGHQAAVALEIAAHTLERVYRPALQRAISHAQVVVGGPQAGDRMQVLVRAERALT
jgi:hypothetical protein